jgi:hypothetical protein
MTTQNWDLRNMVRDDGMTLLKLYQTRLPQAKLETEYRRNRRAVARIDAMQVPQDEWKKLAWDYASVYSSKWGAVVFLLLPKGSVLKFRSLRTAKVWIKKRRAKT